MGNLIHDRKQKPLPWESRKTTCRRCKGGRQVKTIGSQALHRAVRAITSHTGK